MKAQQFKRHYPMKQGTGISVDLSVILYEEDGMHYAYCAALDVLGYGLDDDEAKLSFEVMLEEILKEAVSEGNLYALLESYGWHKSEPPKISDLISRSEELADIINNKAYRTIRENITIPSA